MEWNYQSDKSFEEKQEDLSAFAYSDIAFTYTRGDFMKTILWSDITEINVYKKDLLTTDEIRMEIVYGVHYIEISEEIPGWHHFVKRTKEIFPTIPANWDTEIIHPPFASSHKTIYARAARNFAIHIV